MTTGPLAVYRDAVAAGRLHGDMWQSLAAEKLEALAHALVRYRPKSQGGWKARLGLSLFDDDPPQGLYLFGSVGRGKSMLMDIFFAALDMPRGAKRRVHFHEFMIEVHDRLHAWRQRTANAREADPLPRIAAEIAGETWLLCFDEFQVTNVADAMILGRLFTALLDEGVIIVATSNRAPDELYPGGLQRERFLPFIDLLNARLDVLHLAGETDYRLLRLKEMDVYFTPDDGAAAAALDAAFHRLTEHDAGERVDAGAMTLTAQGREVAVPLAARGIARFTFDDLCGKPLGAADYLAIAREFHTVIIGGIPRMGPGSRDRAARFVTLIDALYENRVKLVCSAAAEPAELYAEGDGAFEFQRTASRLIEMRSAEYKALEHARGPAPGAS